MTINSASPAKSLPRVAWLDIARGMMVVFVVLFHYRIWVSATLEIPEPLWGPVARDLTPFRMPVLFAISGLLAASAIKSGWTRKTARRVASSFYLYLVWLLVYFGISFLIPENYPHAFTDWQSLLWQLIAPQTPLWFILFLGIFVALFATLRKLPPIALLVGTLCLSVIFDSLESGQFGYILRGMSYIYCFAVGFLLREIILRFANGHVLIKFAASATTLSLIAMSPGRTVNHERPFHWLVMNAAEPLAAIGVAVTASVVISRIPFVGRALEAVGKRTLEIYVLHLPILWAVMLITTHLNPEIFTARWLSYIGLPIMVTAVCAAAIGVGAIARRFAISRALFNLPQSVQRALRLQG